MPLPELLTLVRHGESEGNIAVRASRHGDDKYFTDEYRNRHSANLRLTDQGIEEAKLLGRWLINSKTAFTHFQVSSHLRALETAGYLGIPGANWQIELRLRERDFGDWDMNSYGNRAEDPRFIERGVRRFVEGVYWRPPNGDSIADDAAIATTALLRDWSTMPDRSSLIAVTHNDKMNSFQLLLNRENLHTIPGDKSIIGSFRTNCHVLQYSRRSPEDGTLSGHFVCYRSIPFPPEKNESVKWILLQTCLSNEELIKYAARFPRVIVGGEK